MIRSMAMFAMTAALVVGLGHTGVSVKAEDKKGDEKEPKIESKKEKATPLPNFAKAYGLSFASLETLGSRLTEARMKDDPISLALIASELATNEQVSGKKADLTSAALLKEAIELAKMRRQEKELQAVAILIRDEAASKELNALAEVAKKAEAERIAAFKSGEKQKGFKHLTVVNHTDVKIHIRANGHHLGWVNPYGQYTFNTPYLEYHDPVHVKAHDAYGDEWKAHSVYGPHLHATWHIYP